MKLSILAFLLSFCTSAFSINFYWIGANGADWNTLSNWSSTTPAYTPVTTLPTSADVVRINENTVTISSGVNAIAKYIIVTTTNETKPSKVIVEEGGSLTIAANNTSTGACVYLRGGAIQNNGTITLNVNVTPSGYGIFFQNSTTSGISTPSSYSGEGALIVNASGQTEGGAIQFTQTIANPEFTINDNNNLVFNLANGKWAFNVHSGSNAIISGSGTLYLGTALSPSVSGLFKLINNYSSLTIESDVTINSQSNGTFAANSGVIYMGDFNNANITNKGTINIHTVGANAVYCGTNTNILPAIPNSLFNEGTLTVDGGSAIIFGGSGLAKVTNTGVLIAENVPQNAYSVGVFADSPGSFALVNTAPGIMNLESGLGISPLITEDNEVVAQVLIDPETPINIRPVLDDNLLPTSSKSNNWDVVFSDEFNGAKMDATKWTVENSIRYRDVIKIVSDQDQVEVKNGNAYLKYSKSLTIPNTYYVGRFNSSNKFSTTYGYFECRMHVIKPEGYQVAFWLMPQNGITPNGVIDGTANDGAEVDIVEGNKMSDRYSCGLHWDGYGAGHKSNGSVVNAPGLHTTEFNTFGFEWAPNFLRFYHNGKVVRTMTADHLMIHVPEFILLTGSMWDAVGWVEMDVRDNTALNSGLTNYAYVDYIRVFKNRLLVSGTNQEKIESYDVTVSNSSADGVFEIHSSSIINAYQVLNSQGQLILSKTGVDNTNLTVDLANCSNGVYILRLRNNENKYITRKIIRGI